MRIWERREREEEGQLWKGVVAGLIGGLVASWTMDQFQSAWSKLSERMKESNKESHQRGDGQIGGQDKQQLSADEQDPATVKAASIIAEEVFDRRLAKDEKEVAGEAVHYSFGLAAGGLYGAAAEVMPPVTTCAGMLFGSALWLVADEIAVPLMGLSKPPTKYPLSTHAYALASHLVYGLALDLTRREVRRAL
jgi:uncharacterized membrane protein YagU involved in acid resistance